MDDTGERIPGVSSLSEQEEFSAEVKGLVFVTSTEKEFMVKGLEAEHMGTNTSVDTLVEIFTLV